MKTWTTIFSRSMTRDTGEIRVRTKAEGDFIKVVMEELLALPFAISLL